MRYSLPPGAPQQQLGVVIEDDEPPLARWLKLAVPVLLAAAVGYYIGRSGTLRSAQRSVLEQLNN